MAVGDDMKWEEMSKHGKLERVNRTFAAIDENEPAANFWEYFKEVNPDIEITEKQLYLFMEEEYGEDNP